MILSEGWDNEAAEWSALQISLRKLDNMYSARPQPNPDFFPTHAFGPRLQGVVNEAAQSINSSITPVAISLLSAMSLVAQGIVQVEKRPDLVSPVSLFLISIQSSGERKSSAHKVIFRGIQRFLSEASKAHEEDRATYEAKLLAWSAKLKGMQSAIRKCAHSGKCAASYVDLLREHAKQKPKPPLRFKLSHENTTPSAMVSSLKGAYPTTSLISDEALMVIKGRGLTDPGILNKMWDGSPISLDRVAEGETYLESPALTMCLFLQDGAFDGLMNNKFETFKDSGFLARCFVVKPAPMAGQRLLAYASPSTNEHLTWFYAACKSLLLEHVATYSGNEFQKRTFRFSTEAQAKWERIHDYFEQEMLPGRSLEYYRDVGSKHAEKIARLSALLHLFEGETELISFETLNRAVILCDWLLTEFKRIFPITVSFNQEEQDLRTLESWLMSHFHRTGERSIYKNYIRQSGPNSLRSRDRLNIALAHLGKYNFITEHYFNNGKKKAVYLTDLFFSRVNTHFHPNF